jgi:DHA1 family multidrug resistance protein-like MFS transporter
MSVDLILLFASLFTWGIGEGMFIYFQPIYLQQLGASTMTIATVFSAFGLAMMLAHIPAGYLADRIGRKPVIIAAWTSGLIATWVMALARTLPAFIVGVLLYGLTAFVSAPLNSYVTAARGKLTPVRAMTFMSAAFNLGAVLGPISGGWLGERFGLRTVYLVAACIFIASTGILLFIRSQPCDKHDPAAPPEKLWTNTRFITLVGIVFVAMFVMYLPQPLTPKFLQNERGLSLGSIGLLGSVGSLGNAALNLILGQVGARTGFLLAQVSVAFFSLLLWKGMGVPWYALGYFLLGGYRASRSFIYAQARPLVHPAQMGLAYGVAETFNSLSMTLAPLLAGILYTHSPVVVYPISLGLVGLAILLTIAFAPRLPIEEPAALSQSLEL